MENTKVTRFIIWLFSSIFLGILPWLVNFLVLVVMDQINYYAILRVNDLMFFVVILSATTMLDLFILKDTKQNSIIVMFWILLLVLVLVASVLLGISSFYVALPPTAGPFAPIESRLILGGLILCGFAFLTSLLFQIYVCFLKKPY